jgi:hypothetical protein
VAYFQIGCGTDSEPLSKTDIAAKIKELVEVRGQKVVDVAKRLGCSDQHVRDMIKLASVSPDLKQAIDRGAISPSAAVKTSRARDDAQREVKEKLERGEKVSGRDVETADGKPTVMSFEDIQKQIKKADANFARETTARGQERWRAMVEAFRIVIGAAEKLK